MANLSPRLVSDLIERLRPLPGFADLTAAEVLSRINGVFQKIAGLYNAAGKTHFVQSSMTPAVLAPVAAADNIRAGEAVTGLKDVATVIPFTTPLSGSYVVTIIPAAGIPVDCPEAGWAANGITVYGGEDNTPFFYIAIRRS